MTHKGTSSIQKDKLFLQDPSTLAWKVDNVYRRALPIGVGESPPRWRWRSNIVSKEEHEYQLVVEAS